MIRYYRKVAFLTVCETWFNATYNISSMFRLIVFRHLKDASKISLPGVKEISHTVELHLEQTTQEIFANFSSDIRRKIKKAEAEGTVCYFHNRTEEFVSFFNDFAEKKKTFTTSKVKLQEMGEYIKMSFAENNGKILAAHSYLVDDEMKIVRGLHSGTTRLNDDSNKSLIGRAHKLLVVKDILFFKENGFKIFDFGGYAENTKDESLQNINRFKLSFGGKVISCINYYSYSYWLLRKVSKVLGLSGKL
jgi:lipid II:glycine glycyltransferase (peptidoglycan interpeptide bridge formation enzyme)